MKKVKNIIISAVSLACLSMPVTVMATPARQEFKPERIRVATTVPTDALRDAVLNAAAESAAAADAESIPLETEPPLEEDHFINHEVEQEFYPELLNVGDRTESGDVLMYLDETRKVVYSEKYGTFEDQNGIVPEGDLIAMGLVDGRAENNEANTLSEKVPVKLSFTTEFEGFSEKEEPPYTIVIEADGESSFQEEEEIKKNLGTIYLTKDNSFTNEQTITCENPKFYMTAVVPSDRADAYQVKIFNGAEECYIYDSLVPEYQLKVKVIKPEYTVTDPNEAPQLSEDFENIASGKYAESRASELDIEFGEEETESQKEEVKKSTGTSVIALFAATLGLIAVLGGGIWFLYKRANRDDD